ncbi:MAG: hypothetical protein ACPG5B_15750 [Chitinophagales bacterium]
MLGISAFNLKQQGEILGDYYTLKNSPTTATTTLALYKIYVNEVRSRKVPSTN